MKIQFELATKSTLDFLRRLFEYAKQKEDYVLIKMVETESGKLSSILSSGETIREKQDSDKNH